MNFKIIGIIGLSLALKSMMLKILRFLLFPISVIYGLVTAVRNLLFDWGVFKSTAFDIPVIVIGNLAVGGTGKTPTTEYLVEILKSYKIAILSRGYGRKTKGFLLAKEGMNASDLGDEPLQYFLKFNSVTVAVCEDRVYGINQLKANHDLILLDDAFQHRRVRAGFSILLFDFQSLFHWQFLLPTGNLREYFSAYRRADAILITKSPQTVNMVDQISVHKKFELNTGQRLSFSSITYGQLRPLFKAGLVPDLTNKEVILLTGIANPKPLARHLSQFDKDLICINYPDHHDFKRRDLEELRARFAQPSSKEKIIVTTEKDTMRLLGEDLKDLLVDLPIFYLPIKFTIASKDKSNFDQKILEYVASAKRIDRVP